MVKESRVGTAHHLRFTLFKGDRSVLYSCDLIDICTTLIIPPPPSTIHHPPSTMFANIVSHQWFETTAKTDITLELIVFGIDEVSFGIPIHKLDRIISNVHLDEDCTLIQHVEILDLHDRLTGVAIANPTAIAIFANDNGQLLGIPIATVPTLIDVPLDRIRTLPSEFRTNNAIGIASHVALIDDSIATTTIFILAT